MFTYLGIYLYAFISSIIENIKGRENIQKISSILLICILALISGTRYYLGGTDYYIYNNVFSSIPTLAEFFGNFNILDQVYTTYGMEDGYLFLNSFIKTLGFNFFGFTLFHSIFFYSVFFKCVSKYTNRMGLVIVVFLYKLFFYNTFISMRQSLTIALFWFMLEYIEEKQFIKYMIGCLICIKLHTASIILIPLYFINRIQISKKLIIRLNMIFIPTILISIAGINIMVLFEPLLQYMQDPTAQSKAANMINSSGGGINLLHTLEYFIIMFLVIRNYDAIIKCDTDSKLIIKLFLVLLPLFTLFRNVEILTRVKDYFTITYGILLGYICVIRNKRDVLKILIIIYYCAFTFFRFILLFDNGELIQYESYILKGIGILR